MKTTNQVSLMDSVMTGVRPHYFSLFAFSAFINILMLAPSWYMLQVYDRVLTSQDDNTLIGLSLIILFLYGIYALLERYRSFILIGVAEVIDAKMAPVLHATIFRSKSHGITGLTDLNNVKQFMTGQPILAFLDAPWAIVYLSVITLIHPKLGIFSVISVLIMVILAVVNQKLTNSRIQKSNEASMGERNLALNALNASDSIVSMGMEKSIRGRIAFMRSKYIEYLIDASTNGANVSALTKLFRNLIQSAALGYGAYLAIQHEITAGMIIAGSILLGKTLSPIESLLNSWKQIAEFQKSYANLKLIFASSSEKAESVDLGRPQGRIQMVNVSLRLREQGKPTLEGINVMVEPGETLAIVGASGAGKTSVLKAMAGLHKLNQGQVLIDGSDVAFRDFNSLGKFIGYLSQSTDLLAGRIAENISRLNPVDNDQVIRAAKLSGAHETILSLPEGYEAILGDNGSGLSEGQKRKIGLARAFYGSPSILFLDEPGNGLDEASLNHLIGSIKEIQASGVTVIFTTHQSAFLHLAHKVLVMNEGKVQLHAPTTDVFPQTKV